MSEVENVCRTYGQKLKVVDYITRMVKMSHRPMLKNISGIETLCVENKDPTTAIVLLHGYGANMQDLYPLWEIWDNKKYNWYFPNGILPLPMGHYEGRAWFSIDMEALDRAIRSGEFRNMAETIPPEIDL